VGALEVGAGTALTVAAALRLGLLPPHRPIPELAQLPPALHTLAWLAGSAPGWLALVRGAAGGVPNGAGWLLLLGALTLIYAVSQWLQAATAREGLPYWTLALAALALGSAGRGLPFAALGWGVSGLLTGGLMALALVRSRRLLPVLLLGSLALTGLPFTPAWPGAALFEAPLFLTLPIYLLSQAFLLVGVARLVLRNAPPPPTAERWVWLIYPLGLGLLPATGWVILFGLRPGVPGGLTAWPGWISAGLIVMSVGLAVLLAAGGQRYRRKLPHLRPTRVFELRGLYMGLHQGFNALGRAARLAGWALEGRAGLLWALLVLALLLSLLAQMGIGG
jgi:hypothetical protein